MKSLISALAIAFNISAHANTLTTEIQNDPPGIRNCTTQQDIGKWGYRPYQQAVYQVQDELTFDVSILNMICAANGWVLEHPDVITTVGPQGQILELVNLSGFIHEVDGFKQAVYSDAVEYQTRQEFSIVWKVNGLESSLAHLGTDQEFRKQFVFGLKASYREVENHRKTFTSVSGKYIITMTWTKQNDGSVTQRSDIRWD